MTVTPPTIRQDLLEEEDYIEEVARIYGYDKTVSYTHLDVYKRQQMKLKRDFRTQRFCLLEQSEVWKRRWFQITDIRSS